MMQAQLYQPVPLTYSRLCNGIEVTGLSISVTILACDTGTTLLALTSLTEVVPGQYSYIWNNSITEPIHCKAIYNDSGYNFVEYFDIEDDDDTVERSTGKTA